MSSDDNVTTQKQGLSLNKRHDDFDMAKLQKRLNQEHRHHLTPKHKVAKLTPAEIRSLNHSADVSKSASLRSVDQISIRGSDRVPSSTPPLTPDTPFSPHQLAPQRHGSAARLPTPPHSPSSERRGSNASARQIHAPKPISHVQAPHLSNGIVNSRSPSANSYRGVATYRGPEITRTGSLTMLQHPPQNIVSNPLSQFSRPRQSTLTSSPQKTTLEPLANDDSPASVVDTQPRQQPLGVISHNPSRDHSPVRVSDSPVSMEGGKVPDMNKVGSNGSGGKPVTSDIPEVESDANGEKVNAETSEKQAKHKVWRKTLTGPPDKDQEPTPLRKEHRRRTLMAPKNGYCLHAISYSDTKPGEPPLMRNTLKDELPSSKTSVFKEGRKSADMDTEYGQHPAVRPLSTDGQPSADVVRDSSSSVSKGKRRELDLHPGLDTDGLSLSSSVPSYSRCNCCGRVTKPGGFDSDLSPVLENENLRTNFSLEANKSVSNQRKRSSSISTGARRYTPIIPMEVGNETKQARIEPMNTPISGANTAQQMKGVAVNKLGDVIGPGSVPLAIMPRSRTDPRLSRFGSLHAKIKETDDDANAEEQMSSQNLPPHQAQRFVSLYGLREIAQQQERSSSLLQGQSQGAYQAQQVRHYSLPNNYRPVKSSRLAQGTEDYTPITASNDDQQSIHQNSTPAVEKPLSDSPTSPKESHPVMQSDATSSKDDDEPVFDLSSVDGSFVHNSLSRRVTILRDHSPVNGVNGTNSIRTPIEANTSRALTPASNGVVSKIDTSDYSSSIGQAITTPSAIRSAPAATASRSLSGSPVPTDSSLTNGTHGDSQTTRTTIVRIIPTASLTASVPRKPSDPLKLGDWVLPASPNLANANARGGSGQSTIAGA
ncbi:hypothetical protein LTR64_004082 [Lithohypha guttulata]|uniref:uncharacterized protein n=1 Tax=Lithohypha guttulata TaxID=1690604 RepID=UPI00315C6889